MPARRDTRTEMPPLLAHEARCRLGALVRQHHELLRQISRMAPRCQRRLDAEREIALLTRQILATEVELGASRRTS